MSTFRTRDYPRNLIKHLFEKYIEQDRIPNPTSLEGKNRWVVSRTIKLDVKRIRRWNIVNSIITEEKPVIIARKLLYLYLDACEILNENVNERADYYNALNKIIESWENQMNITV